MRAATMRRIDYWAGRPLCLLLTCARRLADAAGIGAIPEAAPRKILFSKL